MGSDRHPVCTLGVAAARPIRAQMNESAQLDSGEPSQSGEPVPDDASLTPALRRVGCIQDHTAECRRIRADSRWLPR
jgi:hypothetical protein